MDILSTENIFVKIHGSSKEVTRTFLTIFLSSKSLTDTELKVLTELVLKYAKYAHDKVSEPYASKLLFSTDTRKEVCVILEFCPEQLSNTFRTLCSKEIIGKEDKRYIMNPQLVPVEELSFSFHIDAD